MADGVDAAGVAVETLAWAEGGSFGLVFRWQGDGDHYRFSVGAQRLRLVRVRAGSARELWSEPGSYEPGVPTRLVVQADGARIRCQVDERLVCDIVEPGVEVAPGGSVGLYTWNSDSAAFDELRARSWPGPALAPEREFSAELEASRPLFTDAFEDLDAFEQVVLSSGAAATAGSATGGTATLVRPRSEDGAVAVLAGDPVAADYVVECTARPDAAGAFGLVARHGESGHLTLQLDPSGGRSLVETRSAAGKFGAVRVLWRDDGAVDVGATYALALRCEGTTVTATIDGEEFTGHHVAGERALRPALRHPGTRVRVQRPRRAQRAAHRRAPLELHHLALSRAAGPPRHVRRPDVGGGWRRGESSGSGRRGRCGQRAPRRGAGGGRGGTQRSGGGGRRERRRRNGRARGDRTRGGRLGAGRVRGRARPPRRRARGLVAPGASGRRGAHRRRRSRDRRPAAGPARAASHGSGSTGRSPATTTCRSTTSCSRTAATAPTRSSSALGLPLSSLARGASGSRCGSTSGPSAPHGAAAAAQPPRPASCASRSDPARARTRRRHTATLPRARA